MMITLTLSSPPRALARSIIAWLATSGSSCSMTIDGDLVRLDVARQPIRTQDEPVAGAQVRLVNVHIDFFVLTERAVEDVAHRVFFGLLVGQMSGGDQRLDKAVIGGDLGDALRYAHRPDRRGCRRRGR